MLIPLSGRKIIIPCHSTDDAEITIRVKSKDLVSVKKILSSLLFPLTEFKENGFGFDFNLTPKILAEDVISLCYPLF